jgi:hypothetical protein
MVADASPGRLNARKDGKREIMDIFLSSKPLVKPKTTTETACLSLAFAYPLFLPILLKSAVRPPGSAVLAE